jgi:hypothetical protein
VSLPASGIGAKFPVFFSRILSAHPRIYGFVGTMDELATPLAGLQVRGMGGRCSDSVGKHDARVTGLCEPVCIEVSRYPYGTMLERFQQEDLRVTKRQTGAVRVLHISHYADHKNLGVLFDHWNVRAG